MLNRKLQVIIADDEYLICELIKKMIRWQELQVEFAGYAHNGQELLEQIKKMHPDIVITDISMPLMDGIELIRQTRLLNIPCRFIIISGYKQFEYAHNALKYSVDDYILKPINENELNKSIKKIINQLSSQALTDTVHTVYTEQPGKSFFLKRIIWEIQNKPLTIKQVVSEYNIDFKEGLFRVIKIKIDFINIKNDDLDNIESLNNKLIYMFHEEFGGFCNQILSYMENSSIYLGINYDKANAPSFEKHLSNFYQNTHNLLDLFAFLKITIGVGNAYPEITMFANSFKDAVDATYYRMICGCGQIIYYEKISPLTYLSKEEKNIYIQNFKRSVEAINLSEFMNLINQLFFKPKHLFPLLDTIDIIKNISLMLSNSDLSLNKEDLSIDYLSGQINYAIENALTLEALKEAVVDPVSHIFNNILSATQTQNAKPVRIVLKYIEEHYNEQINLEDMAELVSLNPAYLSNIFKKETGDNFVYYLNAYRIEKAKELLKNTQLTINEVAYSVGFMDGRYFSKSFKKHVGITPKDYRKIYG